MQKTISSTLYDKIDRDLPPDRLSPKSQSVTLALLSSTGPRLGDSEWGFVDSLHLPT